MKNMSIPLFLKWKKLLIWLIGTVAVLLVIVYLSGYLIVEVLLLSSYRHMALGQYQETTKNSERAIALAQYLYPATSKHYQNMVLYDMRVWAKIGMMGVSAIPPFGLNITELKTIGFENKYKNQLPREDMARIKIESARLANATNHGAGAFLVEDIARHPPNDLLAAHAQEELAYKDLTGFFATLSPHTKEQRKLNESVVEKTTKEHRSAQEKICSTDRYQCRFNNLRWEIGICIRRAYLKEVPVCDQKTLFSVTNFIGESCKNLSVNQCYVIMDGMLPYYQQLLLAQGNR